MSGQQGMLAQQFFLGKCTQYRYRVTNTSSARSINCSSQKHQTQTQVSYDLVLSSGFLAFAAHCGFLLAVQESKIPVRGIMGTSSGALVGSMYAAGYTAEEIAQEFSRVPPIDRLSISPTPWKGLLTLKPVAKTLKRLLPPTFEQLSRNFAVGVVTHDSRYHELVENGSLSEAVLASAAVPVLFSPVHIPQKPQGPYIDGGVACRIGLDLWRRESTVTSNDVNDHPAIVHLIGRSSRWSGNDDTSLLYRQNASVVESPKSGASLWDLTGFEEQMEASYSKAMPVLKQLIYEKELSL